jgi:hypothetical protein
MYHLRITSIDEKFERLVKQCFRKYFMVKEEADSEVSRTHTHTHCEDPIYAERTIRNRLSELTNRNQDKTFSFTKVKKGRDDNIQYLCKGKSKEFLPEVVINNFLNNEDIQSYHNKYWEIRNSNRPPKQYKEKVSFLEECIEMAKSDEWSAKWESDREYITPYMKRQMFSLVTKMLGSKKKILDALIVRRLCNGVFNVILPYKFRDESFFNEVYPISSQGDW